MGVLFDYFAAPTAEAAAATIDWTGGPSQPPAAGSKARRGWFGRRADSAQPAVPAGYRTVQDTGVDPIVQAGTLEEILTGRSFEEILDSLGAASIAERDGGQRLVSKLSDGLVDALAAATPETLATAAEPWSQTEEFWGTGDPEALAALLVELAELARYARGQGDSVYCWTCV